MAKLIDHAHRSVTRGSVMSLFELMVNAQMAVFAYRCADPARAAEISVRSTIRRGGCTAARQELVMSVEERTRWEADNPPAD